MTHRTIRQAQRNNARALEIRQTEALEHIATSITTLLFARQVTTPALRAWNEAHSLPDDAPRDLRR